MPHHDCPLEQALAKTKSSKSSKSCCPSVCDTSCCKSDCQPDCCTPAYLRLDKQRELWSLVATLGYTFLPLASQTIYRNGNAVPLPNLAVFGPEGHILTASGSDNAYAAYIFVNTTRYLTFEACGKEDQVLGWYVNTTSGQLEIFQNLPEYNLLTTDNRVSLITDATSTLTSVQKKKLYNLNILYKLTEEAIERVGGNPKEEGNICEYTDKCGQKWLLAINRADSQADVSQYNGEYVVVGVRLC